MMRRSKKKEDIEVQTTLVCTPHLLREGDVASVKSNQNTQTLATASPLLPDEAFYNQLQRIDATEIQKDYIRILRLKRKLTFSDVVVPDTRPSYYSVKSWVANSDILPPIEDHLHEEVQTRLMVFPHYLRHHERATVTCDISIQTAVTCEPESSLSEIVPQLRAYLEHTGREVTPGDNINNRSILDIIKEILNNVDRTHDTLFDDTESLSEELSNSMISLTKPGKKNAGSDPMTDDEQEIKVTIPEPIEQVIEEIPLVKNISCPPCGDNITEIAKCITECKYPEIRCTYDNPFAFDQCVPCKQIPETNINRDIPETKIETESGPASSVDQQSETGTVIRRSPNGSYVAEVSNNDITVIETAEGDDIVVETETSYTISTSCNQPEEKKFEECELKSCEHCLCQGLKINLCIKNFGLTAAEDPNKINLDLNLLPGFEKLEVREIIKAEQLVQQADSCQKACCPSRLNKNTCPSIMKRMGDGNSAYFVEDQNCFCGTPDCPCNENDLPKDEDEEIKAIEFCEKNMVKKKISADILDCRAMSISNILDGAIMTLVSRSKDGFDVVININSPKLHGNQEEKQEDNTIVCPCDKLEPVAPKEDNEECICGPIKCICSTTQISIPKCICDSIKCVCSVPEISSTKCLCSTPNCDCDVTSGPTSKSGRLAPDENRSAEKIESTPERIPSKSETLTPVETNIKCICDTKAPEEKKLSAENINSTPETLVLEENKSADDTENTSERIASKSETSTPACYCGTKAPEEKKSFSEDNTEAIPERISSTSETLTPLEKSKKCSCGTEVCKCDLDEIISPETEPEEKISSEGNTETTSERIGSTSETLTPAEKSKKCSCGTEMCKCDLDEIISPETEPEEKISSEGNTETTSERIGSTSETLTPAEKSKKCSCGTEVCKCDLDEIISPETEIENAPDIQTPKISSIPDSAKPENQNPPQIVSLDQNVTCSCGKRECACRVQTSPKITSDSAKSENVLTNQSSPEGESFNQNAKCSCSKRECACKVETSPKITPDLAKSENVLTNQNSPQRVSFDPNTACSCGKRECACKVETSPKITSSDSTKSENVLTNQNHPQRVSFDPNAKGICGKRECACPVETSPKITSSDSSKSENVLTNQNPPQRVSFDPNAKGICGKRECACPVETSPKITSSDSTKSENVLTNQNPPQRVSFDPNAKGICGKRECACPVETSPKITSSDSTKFENVLTNQNPLQRVSFDPNASCSFGKRECVCKVETSPKITSLSDSAKSENVIPNQNPPHRVSLDQNDVCSCGKRECDCKVEKSPKITSPSDSAKSENLTSNQNPPQGVSLDQNAKCSCGKRECACKFETSPKITSPSHSTKSENVIPNQHPPQRVPFDQNCICKVDKSPKITPISDSAKSENVISNQNFPQSERPVQTAKFPDNEEIMNKLDVYLDKCKAICDSMMASSAPTLDNKYVARPDKKSAPAEDENISPILIVITPPTPQPVNKNVEQERISKCKNCDQFKCGGSCKKNKTDENAMPTQTLPQYLPDASCPAPCSKTPDVPDPPLPVRISGQYPPNPPLATQIPGEYSPDPSCTCAKTPADVPDPPLPTRIPSQYPSDLPLPVKVSSENPPDPPLPTQIPGEDTNVSPPLIIISPPTPPAQYPPDPSLPTQIPGEDKNMSLPLIVISPPTPPAQYPPDPPLPTQIPAQIPDRTCPARCRKTPTDVPVRIPSEYPPDPPLPIRVPSQYPPDPPLPIRVPSQYPPDPPLPVKVPTQYPPDPPLPVKVPTQYPPDPPLPVKVPTQYPPDPPLPVKVPTQYPPDPPLPTEIPAHTPDRICPARCRKTPADVPDPPLPVRIPSEYPPDPPWPIRVPSQYPPDPPLPVKVPTQYPPDPPLPVKVPTQYPPDPPLPIKVPTQYPPDPPLPTEIPAQTPDHICPARCRKTPANVAYPPLPVRIPSEYPPDPPLPTQIPGEDKIVSPPLIVISPPTPQSSEENIKQERISPLAAGNPSQHPPDSPLPTQNLPQYLLDASCPAPCANTPGAISDSPLSAITSSEYSPDASCPARCSKSPQNMSNPFSLNQNLPQYLLDASQTPPDPSSSTGNYSQYTSDFSSPTPEGSPKPLLADSVPSQAPMKVSVEYAVDPLIRSINVDENVCPPLILIIPPTPQSSGENVEQEKISPLLPRIPSQHPPDSPLPNQKLPQYLLDASCPARCAKTRENVPDPPLPTQNLPQYLLETSCHAPCASTPGDVSDSPLSTNTSSEFSPDASCPARCSKSPQNMSDPFSPNQNLPQYLLETSCHAPCASTPGDVSNSPLSARIPSEYSPDSPPPTQNLPQYLLDASCHAPCSNTSGDVSDSPLSAITSSEYSPDASCPARCSKSPQNMSDPFSPNQNLPQYLLDASQTPPDPSSSTGNYSQYTSDFSSPTPEGSPKPLLADGVPSQAPGEYAVDPSSRSTNEEENVSPLIVISPSTPQSSGQNIEQDKISPLLPSFRIQHPQEYLLDHSCLAACATPGTAPDPPLPLRVPAQYPPPDPPLPTQIPSQYLPGTPLPGQKIPQYLLDASYPGNVSDSEYPFNSLLPTQQLPRYLLDDSCPERCAKTRENVPDPPLPTQKLPQYLLDTSCHAPCASTPGDVSNSPLSASNPSEYSPGSPVLTQNLQQYLLDVSCPAPCASTPGDVSDSPLSTSIPSHDPPDPPLPTQNLPQHLLDASQTPSDPSSSPRDHTQYTSDSSCLLKCPDTPEGTPKPVLSVSVPSQPPPDPNLITQNIPQYLLNASCPARCVKTPKNVPDPLLPTQNLPQYLLDASCRAPCASTSDSPLLNQKLPQYLLEASPNPPDSSSSTQSRTQYLSDSSCLLKCPDTPEGAQTPSDRPLPARGPKKCIRPVQCPTNVPESGAPQPVSNPDDPASAVEDTIAPSSATPLASAPPTQSTPNFSSISENTKIPSAHTMFRLPNNTVLNVRVTLDMLGNEYTDPNKKEGTEQRNGAPNMTDATDSSFSVDVMAEKTEKKFNANNMNAKESFSSAERLKDNDSFLYVESNKIVNILTPPMTSGSSGSSIKPEHFSMVPEKLNKNISFKPSESIIAASDLEVSIYEPSESTLNKDEKRISQSYEPPKRSSNAQKSKQETEPQTESKDVVYIAFKTCETELKPALDALSTIKQELKNLNIPEVDCIFKQTQLYSEVPRPNRVKERIKQLDNESKESVVRKISKPKCDVKNTPPIPKMMPSNKTTKCRYKNPDFSDSESTPKIYPPVKAKIPKRTSSSSSKLSQNGTSSVRFTDKTCSQNEISKKVCCPKRVSSGPKEYTKSECPRKIKDFKSSSSYQTQQPRKSRYDSAYCSYPTLSKQSVTCSSQYKNEKNIQNKQAKKYPSSSESEKSNVSRVSSRVSSEEFVCPARHTCRKKGKNRKNSSRCSCTSSNMSECPFLEAMKSVLFSGQFRGSKPRRKERRH